ncbi:hypothetical protein CesoFtcFv8_000023 [Champsocephalus esox]|uniref:Uncharacterized protein n=1 Tax=Champsocephalus esox TaxID=159716 RepID=A0AAN8HWL2_9TELE|nr:hypothetical protein CesoFtcFv8_000023 [Champsocephalus esox]
MILCFGSELHHFAQETDYWRLSEGFWKPHAWLVQSAGFLGEVNEKSPYLPGRGRLALCHHVIHPGA